MLGYIVTLLLLVAKLLKVHTGFITVVEAMVYPTLRNESLDSLLSDLKSEYSSDEINPSAIKDKAIMILKTVLTQDSIDPQQAETISKTLREASEAIHELQGERSSLLNELRAIRAASLEYILMNPTNLGEQAIAWLYFDLSSTYKWLRLNPLMNRIEHTFSLCEISTLSEFVNTLLESNTTHAGMRQKIEYVEKEYSFLFRRGWYVPSTFKVALRKIFEVVKDDTKREYIINRRLLSVEYALERGKRDLDHNLRELKAKYRMVSGNQRAIGNIADPDYEDLWYRAGELKLRMRGMRDNPDAPEAIKVAKSVDRFIFRTRSMDYKEIAEILSDFYPTAINFYEDMLDRVVYKPWRRRGYLFLDLGKVYINYSTLFKPEIYDDRIKRKVLYLAGITSYSELLDLLIDKFECRGTLEGVSLKRFRGHICSMGRWDPPSDEKICGILKEVGVEEPFAQRRARLITETSLEDLKNKVEEYEKIYNKQTY